MTRQEALALADEWVAAWNRRDLEAVLARFHEEIAFTSPRALDVVGKETVRGKAALRSYWQAALARIGSLRFVLDRALWDPEHRELAILYTAIIDGRERRVSENLRLDDTGMVRAAEVFHGVARAEGR